MKNIFGNYQFDLNLGQILIRRIGLSLVYNQENYLSGVLCRHDHIELLVIVLHTAFQYVKSKWKGKV